MITRNFKLFLNAGKQIPLMINVSQYDHGEKWVFTLYDDHGQKYVPSSGAIVGIKADNLGIINTGTVNSAGQVEIMETQQMTAAAGKAVFELVIDDGTHGTANFIVLVEPKPGDNADLSESDLSLIQQAIDAAARMPYGSPLVASTVAGMTDHDKVYVYTGSEQGYTNGDWYYWDGDSWEDGGTYNSQGIGANTVTGSKLSENIRAALVQLAQKVAYIDDEGQDYYNDLYHALYDIGVESINAVFTQGSNLIYTNDSLDDLKQYLTVTAYYDDDTTSEVTTYVLSGTLTAGTSTITVTYGTVSTTFDVVVTATILPYGYHRVEYIESDGNQEITKSNLAHTGNTLKINIEYYKESKPTDKSRDIINAIKSVAGSGFAMELGFYSNYDHLIYAYSAASCSINDAIVYQNRVLAEITFTKTDPYTTLKLTSGETVLQNTNSTAVKADMWSDLDVHVFGFDTGSTTRTRVSGRVYDVEIIDANGTIFHGIPCYRVSDGEIGLYDLIADDFLTNNGTGTLTKGADI